MNTQTPRGSLQATASLVEGRLVYATPDVALQPLNGVSAVSSEVIPGGLFIAIPGERSDGHRYVGDAFARGAVGAVVEDIAALEGRPGIVVPSSRIALSGLAHAWYDQPSRDLQMVGITGTNGKSSTAWWLAHLLSSLGLSAFSLGTMGVTGAGWSEPGSLTTPDPLSLHRTLREGVRRDFAAGVMEVSSHALHQERVRDIQFDVGVFTNLSRDHLDYHGTMEDYFTCKKYLFELLASGDSIVKAMVANADTPSGRLLLEEYGAQMLGEAIGFGQSESAHLRGSDFVNRPGGSTFSLSYKGQALPVAVPFLGVHNMENLMAVVGAGLAFGWPMGELVGRLPHLPQVPGRLEQIAGRGITSYVDYAHSPDALSRVITTLRAAAAGRLIVVFGCGGDRDKGKRPLMRQAAEPLADLMIVTSDNPRSEDPERIIADIMEGCTRSALQLVDRRLAIARAVEEARPGDVVLVAGKGHEDYQIIGDQKIHFSDQELLRELLA